jgi:hypothetical protein
MDVQEIWTVNIPRRDDEMYYLARREDTELFVVRNSAVRPAIS